MKRVSSQSDVIPNHKTAILIVDYRSCNLKRVKCCIAEDGIV